jgi:hypothetical protein
VRGRALSRLDATAHHAVETHVALGYKNRLEGIERHWPGQYAARTPATKPQQYLIDHGSLCAWMRGTLVIQAGHGRGVISACDMNSMFCEVWGNAAEIGERSNAEQARVGEVLARWA